MAVPVKGIQKYISNSLSNTLYELNTIMLTNKMCYTR